MARRMRNRFSVNVFAPANPYGLEILNVWRLMKKRQCIIKRRRPNDICGKDLCQFFLTTQYSVNGTAKTQGDQDHTKVGWQFASTNVVKLAHRQIDVPRCINVLPSCFPCGGVLVRITLSLPLSGVAPIDSQVFRPMTTAFRFPSLTTKEVIFLKWAYSLREYDEVCVWGGGRVGERNFRRL